MREKDRNVKWTEASWLYGPWRKWNQTRNSPEEKLRPNPLPCFGPGCCWPRKAAANLGAELSWVQWYFSPSEICSCIPESFPPKTITLIYTTVPLLVVYGYCNKFPQTSWLKTTQKFLSYSFRVQKSKLGFTGLKSRCLQGQFLLGNSRGESISLSFPTSRDHPHSLACDPSSFFKAGNTRPSLLTLPLLLLPSLFYF